MSAVNVIELNCPSCGKPLKIKREMAGRRLACPKPGCGALFDVPGVVAQELQPGFQAKLMLVLGIVFGVIALGLTIRQLDLYAGWYLLLAIVASIVALEFSSGPAKTGLLFLFSLLGLSTPVLFFRLMKALNENEIVFYAGTVLFLIGSVYLIVRMHGVWSQFEWGSHAKKAINLESCIVWFALIASSVAFWWVNYYKFLTVPAEEEFLARRLLFTLFFVVVGVICSVSGKYSPLPFLGAAGLTYMAVGVVKALAYDIGHTTGMLRIGVFASCGVVLLLGGFLMKKAARPKLADAGESAFIED